MSVVLYHSTNIERLRQGGNRARRLLSEHFHHRLSSTKLVPSFDNRHAFASTYHQFPDGVQYLAGSSTALCYECKIHSTPLQILLHRPCFLSLSAASLKTMLENIVGNLAIVHPGMNSDIILG
ncbi:hypothetical protein N7G274_010045 [Stereocaulon virgatum]|uniref:Uncharacterized protein n=1 Tax=Stereocaulon virgatum TaxID=373712 RepID=A0ABR3ZUD0_9LECA